MDVKQTTTIGESDFSLEGARVIVKLIRASTTSLVDQGFVDKLIESNNRQNNISEKMLKSNHPVASSPSKKDERHWIFLWKEGEIIQCRKKSWPPFKKPDKNR